MNAKILLRWATIAGFGGYGSYTLVDEILHVSSQPNVHWAEFWFFLLPFILIHSGLFIAVAYFVFRRQYRHLGTLISGLAAVVICGLLCSLILWLGVDERLYDWSQDSPWVTVIALPISLAVLFSPFYAAHWTYRRVQAFLSKHVHEDPKPEQA